MLHDGYTTVYQANPIMSMPMALPMSGGRSRGVVYVRQPGGKRKMKGGKKKMKGGMKKMKLQQSGAGFLSDLVSGIGNFLGL